MMPLKKTDRRILLRALAERTRQSYVSAVRQLIRRHPPREFCSDEVQNWGRLD
jgi:hypothetical protein